MELSSIQKFLEVYKQKLFAEEHRQQTVIDAVNLSAGILLTPEMITIRDHTLYITASSVIKNELFMRKNAILEELRKNGRSDIVDIA